MKKYRYTQINPRYHEKIQINPRYLPQIIPPPLSDNSADGYTQGGLRVGPT